MVVVVGVGVGVGVGVVVVVEVVCGVVARRYSGRGGESGGCRGRGQNGEWRGKSSVDGMVGARGGENGSTRVNGSGIGNGRKRVSGRRRAKLQRMLVYRIRAGQSMKCSPDDALRDLIKSAPKFRLSYLLLQCVVRTQKQL